MICQVNSPLVGRTVERRRTNENTIVPTLEVGQVVHVWTEEKDRAQGGYTVYEIMFGDRVETERNAGCLRFL